MSKSCRNCGAELGEQFRYCPQCAFPVEPEEVGVDEVEIENIGTLKNKVSA